MVTARAGSAMTATIGNMAVTEQIDALRSLAVDPMHTSCFPACWPVVALPLSTAMFSLTGVAAAYLFGVTVLGLDGLAFMSNVRSSVEWTDVSIGLCKSMMFGVVIAWIATFRGFATKGGALGVGRATSRTVVETAVLVLCGDYVVTACCLRLTGKDHTHVRLHQNRKSSRASSSSSGWRRSATCRSQSAACGSGRGKTRVSARFSNLGDLKARAPVKIAGVTIGRVESIRLVDYYGQVELAIGRDGLAADGHHRVDRDRGAARRVPRRALARVRRGQPGRRRPHQPHRAGRQHHRHHRPHGVRHARGRRRPTPG